MPPEILRSWGHKNTDLLIFQKEYAYAVSGSYAKLVSKVQEVFQTKLNFHKKGHIYGTI